MSPPRQSVYGRAAVATSQPLASAIGANVLQTGGNAFDAAIAAAAALAVTEPCSNGLGGDGFALLYHASTKSVTAVHANGAAPAALTADIFENSPQSPHGVTVPGAVAGWIDILDRYGSHNLSDLLAPSIKLAQDGFPVGPITAAQWQGAQQLLRDGRNGDTFLVGGSEQRAPRAGEIFQNPDLADTLRAISEHGKDGFYAGRVAQAIVDVVQELGGVLTMEDMSNHETQFTDSISTTYRGYTVHEVGPPTQGAVALLALNVLEQFQVQDGSDEEVIHKMVEAMRLSFAEATAYIADPCHAPNRCAELLDKMFAKKQADKIGFEKCAVDYAGSLPGGGTVQFCVVDANGNGASMIQSNFKGFGTCHVPSGCGFTLQNRGLNFSTECGHANEVAGGKKPYNTTIPGLITIDGDLYSTFGVMGGFMQPQGHLQVVSGLIDHGLDPQTALDRARFRVTGKFSSVEKGLAEDGVLVEEGVTEAVRIGLSDRGHALKVCEQTDLFGRGQICVLGKDGVVAAGSDSRADGVAIVL